MPILLLHPVVGDHPMFWVIVFGFFGLVAVALYLIIKLLAGLFSRGGKK